VPLLLGNHDKNIITATDVIETEPLSWSTKEIVIPGLEQDNKAQAITFEFAEGKGMVVIERGGNAIANFNYNILPAHHPLAQAFKPQRQVAQIVSALVDEDYRGMVFPIYATRCSVSAILYVQMNNKQLRGRPCGISKSHRLTKFLCISFIVMIKQTLQLTHGQTKMHGLGTEG